MSQLTTSPIAQELQRDALLTLEQLTTNITVLALHASHRPEVSRKIASGEIPF